VKFWDSSAILPLLVRETGSKKMEALRREDPAISVWWGTRIEVASGLARLVREGALTNADEQELLRRLDALATSWGEVQPGDLLRSQALRLLRTHPLRAADALQLAAALIAADRRPEALPVVTLDQRLGEAAGREGFEVIG
jgi:predicted nucleic acid-binding protein